MASMEEQETIITQNRADDYVSIYTSNSHDIKYFEKQSAYIKIKEWYDAETGEVEAVEFHLPKERANVRKILKATRTITEEQRQAMAERLNRHRKQN